MSSHNLGHSPGLSLWYIIITHDSPWMSDMADIIISVWNRGAQNENRILYNIYVSQTINKPKHPFPPWDLPVFPCWYHYTARITQIKKLKYMMSWEWELKSQSKTVSEYSHITVPAMATVCPSKSTELKKMSGCSLLGPGYKTGGQKS
jgi:hypothetical protein